MKAPGRVRHAHQRDHAVAVQVLRGIFVEATVVVGVVRESVQPVVGLHGGEHRLGAVGVQPRNHVDRLVTQHRRRAGVVEQEANRLERQLAAHDVVAFEVPDHEHRGALVHWDSRRIAYLDEPDLSTLARRADRTHGRVRGWRLQGSSTLR